MKVNVELGVEAVNPEIIMRIFATVQSLERCLEQIKEAPGVRNEQFASLVRLIPQHEQVLIQMRRVANKVQLQFAAGQWDEVVRSLKIFYGLNHLVRTDILALYGVVTSRGKIEFEKAPLAKAQLWH